MRRDVLETIAGIEIFPLISLVIFVGFFALMLFYVTTMSKGKVEELENMPLRPDSDEDDIFTADPKEKRN
ncbi:MAG: CcoQ/FixQ family Cbb3-type cytochrome c oxidase assembly chaperone [Candidatus Cyclonatronum sp.]|uniref:hypothetical protein n=1 Tax=Cyclonatronum sp. TaxID=3024185 RepID=UPI0025BD5B73|nr:hypothetical protein [Cyclonatronum sp.]MCC5935357.1 hypothetical protein [Balneolales bacterium]MCH8485913.1 CcoQ/FixQ family Cbb3-type cytochrome c oxidase assembly chaperone [Cyclonatronum sp.]